MNDFKTKYTKVPNELLRANAVSKNARTLLFYLLSFSTEHRHPSYIQIQRATGLTKRSISKALQELKDRKIIDYEQGRFSDRMANHYRVLDRADWILSSGAKGTPTSDAKKLPIMGCQKDTTVKQTNKTIKTRELKIPKAVPKQDSESTQLDSGKTNNAFDNFAGLILTHPKVSIRYYTDEEFQEIVTKMLVATRNPEGLTTYDSYEASWDDKAEKLNRMYPDLALPMSFELDSAYE